MNTIKALISGANGFIGSHLVAKLKQQEIEVYPLNRLMLYDLTALQNLLGKIQPDYIYALHSYGNLYSQTQEDNIVMANYFATWNLLMASKYINYKAFVHFATSKHSQDSNTFYGATKKGAQALCFAYAKQYDKPIVSIEPYTVIGINEPKEHLIPTLIRSCLYGEEMPFVGDPRHDYIEVKDLVDGVQIIVDNMRITRGKAWELGEGITYSNDRILELVEKATGKKANLKRVKSLRSYDSQDWKADMNKLKILVGLGWRPKMVLPWLIGEMVEYEKQRAKNN